MRGQGGSGAAAVALAMSLLASCASVPEDAGLAEVRAAVERGGAAAPGTGAGLQWRRGAPLQAAVAARVAVLLGADLTMDGAVAVALAENGEIQVALDELGIGQAEMMEAALVRNPVVGAEVRFPAAPFVPFEVTLAQPILDLLARPRRQRVAAARFVAARARASDAVLAVEAETRAAFVGLQAAQQQAALARTVAEAAETARGLAERQAAAGDNADLDVAVQQALAAEARLDLNTAEAEVAAARERLQRALGLGETAPTWIVSAALRPLPPLPPEALPQPPPPQPPPQQQQATSVGEPPPTGLEAAAIDRRPDLAALRSEIEAAAQAVPLGRLAALETAEVGGHSERDPAEGRTTTGPAAAVSVPLWNRGQAARRRAEAVYLQTRDLYAARMAVARSEVRQGWDRLAAARRGAHLWLDELLPARRRILELSETRYNAQLLGIYQLLAAKQDEVRAEARAADALRDYWLARIELERRIGGRLPDAAGGTSSDSGPAAAAAPAISESATAASFPAAPAPAPPPPLPPGRGRSR